MLEKIRLRGTTWEVDTSHCQGCSSQFTFINRKIISIIVEGVGAYFAIVALSKEWFCVDMVIHLFAFVSLVKSSKRLLDSSLDMDTEVELGSLKPALKDEDDVLNRILGAGGKESSSSSGVTSNNETIFSVQRETSGAICSDGQVVVSHDEGGEMHKSQSVDQCMQNDMASISPEKLCQQALEEKRKHKVLKGEGKSEEALRAFKRGKELERQAESLEMYIRKNNKKSLQSGNMSGILNKEVPKEFDRKNKVLNTVGRDKDDLAAELRELGWSDMDLHDDTKRSTKLSLDGEFSSLF